MAQRSAPDTNYRGVLVLGAGRRDDVDWEAVERDYREGSLSLRGLAKTHNVSMGAIRGRAKTHGWVKGERHALRARALTIANSRAIPRIIDPTPERFEELANVGADILVRHRTTVATMQGLAVDLAAQLRFATDHEPELAEALEDYYMDKAANNPLLAGVYKQQLNTALHAIGLGTRAKTMLNLTGSIGKLVELERKAWDMDGDGDKRSYEELLAELAAKVPAVKA